MPGEVRELSEARPHLSGPCRCLDCGARWEGVAEVGTYAMDCPHCGAAKGARFTMILPEDGELIWRCRCNSIFFVLMVDRWMCPNCGEQKRF